MHKKFGIVVVAALPSVSPIEKMPRPGIRRKTAKARPQGQAEAA